MRPLHLEAGGGVAGGGVVGPVVRVHGGRAPDLVRAVVAVRHAVTAVAQLDTRAVITLSQQVRR